MNKKDWINYKLTRNEVNKLMKRSKSNFFNKSVSKKQNINEFWKHLKHVTCDNKSKSVLPKVLTLNGENITDKICIVNKLNDYFVNIAGFINKINFN